MAGCIGLLASLGCTAETPRTDSATANVERRQGVRFDPLTIRRGAEVGTLVVDSVFTQMTVVDSNPIGVARFSGQLELRGQTFRHPDADLGKTESCFEADAASAALMPRWQGDERRPWFCFSNRDEAIRQLGPPGEGVAATVVIDSFTIHRGHSDEVNSARLIDVPTTAALRTAAENVVSFLAGDTDFESFELADSVDLHVAPEGGGAHVRIPRARLRDRQAWRVGTGPSAHSFVPPGRFATMTSHVGTHVNCRPIALSTRFPQLGTRPHVGIRLARSDDQGCLATWNATFVFDTAGGKPRLVAAVYDQWEW